MGERKAYIDTLKTGGSTALAQMMEEVAAGYVQFDQNLRYPLAYAIKVPTDTGELIRVVTNRPMSFTEQMRGFKSQDYPFGVMEIKLPKDGAGEGTILAAADLDFNDKGQLEVKSLPQNTGPQRLSLVEREVVKPKKQKK